MPNRSFTVLIFVLLLSCSGCALIPISAIGAVVGLGNSSVSQGRESFFWGKLKTAEIARFDVARAAVKATANEMGLKAKGAEKLTRDRSEMAFVDSHGSQVGVRIDRETDAMVRMRIDVGWFGSEMVDRLFLLRLREYLPEPATKPIG